MKGTIRLTSFTLLILAGAFWTTQVNANRLLLIEGAPGEQAYAERFGEAVAQWESLAEKAHLDWQLVHKTEEELSPRAQIEAWIDEVKADEPETAWIVYLGHGSFGPEGAKLNLVGDDLSEEELALALNGIESQLVFIHGGSASGPFLTALSGPNRIIITATRSGNEKNYARFGEFFAQALRSDRTDIDLDGRVSLLEAFLSASAAVETFYFEAGRLTSEHALIDDNGDGRGTAATQFKGLRPKNPSQESKLDGRDAKKVSLLSASGERLLTASQIQKRDSLEAELDRLYAKKTELSQDDYYKQLESILLELSKVYLGSEDES